MLKDQGKLAQAEIFFSRALAISEKAYGSEHSNVALSLSNLSQVLLEEGKLVDANNLSRRALAIREKILGVDHPETATTLNNLSSILVEQREFTEAENLLRRALVIQEKVLGPEHLETARSLENLVLVLLLQRKLTEVEGLSRHALAILEKVLGSEHPKTASGLHTLALVLLAQGKPQEAEELFRRVVILTEQSSMLTVRLTSNLSLGMFHVGNNHLKDAIPYYHRAAETLDQLFSYTQGLPEETRHSFLGRYAHIYREYLDLLLRLHEQDAKGGYDREFLAVASRNQSRLFSELLRQGKVRNFSQEPAFIALRDQRESLLSQLLTLREQHATLPVSDPNATVRKAALSQQIDALTADLARVESHLKRDYPRYLELIQPAPVTVEQLQKDLLRPDEVLLSFVLLPEKTVLLAVSRDQFRLHTVPIGRAALTQRIHSLRGGLRLDDQGSITTLSQLDPGELHTLYRDLIAPLEPQLGEGKRLLVVADGPLVCWGSIKV